MMTLTPPQFRGGQQRYLADEHAPADDLLAESGRGLALVAALSAPTGYYFTDDGHKVVWSEIPQTSNSSRPGEFT